MRLIVCSGSDQSIEWSASTITIEEAQVPLLFSLSTNRPTCTLVEASAALRAALRVVPVRSAWPTRSTSPRLTNIIAGSNSSTIVSAASMVAASGACSVIGSSGNGSQRWVARSPKTE